MYSAYDFGSMFSFNILYQAVILKSRLTARKHSKFTIFYSAYTLTINLVYCTNLRNNQKRYQNLPLFSQKAIILLSSKEELLKTRENPFQFQFLSQVYTRLNLLLKHKPCSACSILNMCSGDVNSSKDLILGFTLTLWALAAQNVK